ncbi:hypothetical protein FSP39_005605 [Pinctada imbricata]|uniref:BZIP domain-containing protein n=1 Tax=Pinctada imbricata TaxID=66713 RepID=A0AA89BSH7_PINIB|nr:hypothetical protein FSP39_005605 [Pinctada imbricata]
MVKQDKSNDILDILLGTGVDFGEMLTPDMELLPPMTRFESSDSDALLWQRPDFSQEFQENNGEISPEIEFLGNDIEVETNISVENEVIVPNNDDGLFLSESTNSEFFSTSDDVTTCTNSSFDHLADGVDLVFEEVEDSDYPADLLSPLVKEGIKFKIATRRRAEGKDDLKVEFREPSPERLTEEDEEKRRLKREKNKLAAQKCRLRKRKLAETLEEQTVKLELKQEKLMDEIERLKDEREELRELIRVHKTFCPKLAKS